MTSQYIELRARSAFSFLEGASTPEDLAARAAELGYGALALGDRDGLYGAPRFHQATQQVGIKPIVGAELTLADDSRLYVLVPDRARYRNLCRMLTDAKLRAAKGRGRITPADLERYAGGLVCLAGGLTSPLSRMLGSGADPRPLCARLGVLFGAGNLFIDLQRHLDAHEERLNRQLAALAAACRVPLVTSNDVCHGGTNRQLLDVPLASALTYTARIASRAGARP
jgi:error-prone DNA polymerase